MRIVIDIPPQLDQEVRAAFVHRHGEQEDIDLFIQEQLKEYIRDAVRTLRVHNAEATERRRLVDLP